MSEQPQRASGCRSRSPTSVQSKSIFLGCSSVPSKPFLTRRKMLPTSAFQRRAKPGKARNTFLDNLVARRVAEPQIALSPESRAWDCSNFFGVEQARAKLRVFQAEAGNVREKIKCALSKQ